jgi:hypothetical protein
LLKCGSYLVLVLGNRRTSFDSGQGLRCKLRTPLDVYASNDTGNLILVIYSL